MPAGTANALSIAERAFERLVTGPDPLALPGADLGHGLPPRLIPLGELKDLLMCPDTSGQAIDVAWRTLLSNARTEGQAWVVGCFGVAMPALKPIAARAVHGLSIDHSEDVVSELVAAFLDGIHNVDLNRHAVLVRLVWMARRAATRARRRLTCEIATAPEDLANTLTQAPDAPAWDGVDVEPSEFLTAAVRSKVLTQTEADLISATYLAGVSLTDLAKRLGADRGRLFAARRRARERLVAALHTGQLSAKSLGSVTNPAG